MSHGIYIGMTAASARAQQVDLIADNLANAQTTGFKAKTVRFESFVAPQKGDNGDNGDNDKIMTRVAGTGLDLSRGLIETTGNPMDIVVQDEAWLEVNDSKGEAAYTRNGHLHVGSDGTLLAGRYPIRMPGGAPIMIPDGQVPDVRSDGSVVVQGKIIGQMAFAELSGDLDRVESNLIGLGEGGEAKNIAAKVTTGEIELSNFQGLDAAVEMIQAQRSFDQSMKAIQTYSALDAKLADIGRV
ncbi:MAG: flagellar hook basal-body protein [Deltaproteobacteria bacterium]|nr:flagellar hook basal-body protein [Deltaproteobacteria bacterium]